MCNVLFVLLAACAEQKEPEIGIMNPEEEDFVSSVEKVVVSVKPFSIDDDVKSELSPTGAFQWELNDQIAFIPESKDTRFGIRQSMFYVDAFTAGSATFKAAGWGLLAGRRYYSYYPFDSNATSTSVTISYGGQRQSAPGSSAHLGDYDYLHAFTSPVSSEGGQVIEYSHLGGIGQFRIDLSDIDGWSDKQYKKFILTTGEPILATSAKYNPSEASANIQGQPTNTVSIDLGNDDSGFTCNSSPLDVFAMLCPTTWQGEKVTATLVDSEGKEYSGTFTPKSDLLSGQGKGYAFKVSEVGAVIDLSKDGPANCYIIDYGKEKTYSFPIVYGNTSTPVAGVTKVGVLWETVNTATAPQRFSIIKNDLKIENGKVVFTANGTSGNALIVAYNNEAGDPTDTFSEGKILWSWHIWCPESTPGLDQYGSNYLMSMNLGALNNEANYKSIGLLYQWGRKDPFLGAEVFDYDRNTCAVAMTNDGQKNIPNRCARKIGLVTPTTTNLTTTNFPTVFFNQGSGTDDKIYHWNTDNSTTLWASEKTEYDPCPPGYKVPDANVTAGCSFDPYDNSGKTAEGAKTSKGGKINGHYWPMTGMRGMDNKTSTMTRSGNTASYWTNSADKTASGTSGYVGHCINMVWTVDKTPQQVFQTNHDGKSYINSGNPVRCQKINQ